MNRSSVNIKLRTAWAAMLIMHGQCLACQALVVQKTSHAFESVQVSTLARGTASRQQSVHSSARVAADRKTLILTALQRTGMRMHSNVDENSNLVNIGE